MRVDRPRLARLAASAALCALASCRTAPPVSPAPAPPSWDARRAQLQTREHFALKGRVAIAANDEGFNANFRWLQEGTRTHLTLAGPLGTGGVQISASGDELDVTTANGQHLDSAAARAELASRLGFDPPLPSLRYWVLGVPDPAHPATETLDAAQQRLQSLTQEGWRIDYPAYAMAGGQALPSRLNLRRDTVRVRLLVDDWQP